MWGEKRERVDYSGWLFFTVVVCSLRLAALSLLAARFDGLVHQHFVAPAVPAQRVAITQVL